jgi:hypothetical protein
MITWLHPPDPNVPDNTERHAGRNPTQDHYFGNETGLLTFTEQSVFRK